MDRRDSHPKRAYFWHKAIKKRVYGIVSRQMPGSSEWSRRIDKSRDLTILWTFFWYHLAWQQTTNNKTKMGNITNVTKITITNHKNNFDDHKKMWFYVGIGIITITKCNHIFCEDHKITKHRSQINCEFCDNNRQFFCLLWGGATLHTGQWTSLYWDLL
jgi:hypothetical protein